MTDLKLYYSPGACSLAPHVALEEAGAAYEPVRIDFASTQQRSPSYLAINPKGRVPALTQGDFVLTEAPAILRYVARRFPDAQLWPDTVHDDARCAEWLAWISSTVHVAFAHVRRAERYATGEDAIANVVARGRESCAEVWAAVDKRLSPQGWAAGDRYSVADIYLLVFWLWGRGPVLAYDMPARFPNWTALVRKVSERPAVRRVLEREGQTPPG